MNFTSLVALSVEVLRSPERDTKAHKEAPVTNQARVYKDPLQPSTDEELAGIVTAKELEGIWDKKKDKYGLNEEPNSAGESMKSKILSKEDDPFDSLQTIQEISDLPF
jgi:hypothetical protein